MLAPRPPFSQRPPRTRRRRHPPHVRKGEDLYRRGLYAEAIAWWTEQAAKGDVESARRLGVEYMDGKGGVVERDYEKARKFHLQAAMGVDRRSMMDLGTIYEHGLGVTSRSRQRPPRQECRHHQQRAV